MFDWFFGLFQDIFVNDGTRINSVLDVDIWNSVNKTNSSIQQSHETCADYYNNMLKWPWSKANGTQAIYFLSLYSGAG